MPIPDDLRRRVARRPVTQIPRRRAAPTPSPTPRTSIRKTVSRLKKRYAKMEGTFYDMGKELADLDKPSVLALYGARSFSEFLEAHIMPYRTARRWIDVSTHYPKSMALRLGIHRGFHLLRYVEVAGLEESAKQLARRDAHIGSPPKAISAYTTRELAALVSVERMRAGQTKVPKASRRHKSAVAKFKRDFEERYGFAHKSRLNMKRGVLEIEVPLDELLD